VERQFALGDHLTLVPDAQLGWLSELIDTNARTTASFLQTGGPSFVVDSPSVGRSSAVLGLGATLRTGGLLSLYASYTGAINGQSTAQDITGGLSVTW
jgi:outer membrane autotransporter protein